MVEVANVTKLAIGIVFLLVGALLLWNARGGRGFGQKRQAAAMFLVGGLVFLAIGFGLVGGG